MNKHLICTATIALSLAACSVENGNAKTDATKETLQNYISVPVTAETEPSTSDSAAAAVLWQSNIFGAVEDGIETYDLNGKRISKIAGGEVEALAILPSFGKSASPVLLSLDTSNSSLIPYIIGSDASLTPAMGAKIQSSLLLEGMCSLTSKLDGQHYALLLGSNGQIEQWHIYENKAGEFSGTLTRTLQVGTEPKFCVGDTVTNNIYVTEEAVGVWRFNGDVEAETIPELVDVRKFGSFKGEVGGLAVYYTEQNQGLLIASDIETSTLTLYDIAGDHRFIGRAKIEDSAASDGVENAGSLFASVGTDASLLLTDEDNGDDATNFKIVSLSSLSNAFNFKTALTALPANTPESAFALVYPSVETAPVEDGGDAADDPAIWVHPTKPDESLIIGTNKQGGLYTYALDGKVKQYLPVGKVNNVDLRYNVQVGDESITLIAASNRTHESISLFKMDEATGTLSDIADGVQPTNMADPYGLCLYQSPKDGQTYVFINEKDGLVRQWALSEGSQGRVKATVVREFVVGSTAEGCTADDDTGALFVAEEDVALWKYGAEPDTGDARELISNPQMNPSIIDDLEGVSIYYGEGENGYIVLSSQGNNSYALFDRIAPHTYLGSFRVIADSNAGIDGSSETDGLDIISTPLGSAFPYGVFVAQDGRNISPAENQNFKLVPWESIATPLSLQMYQGRDPRQ